MAGGLWGRVRGWFEADAEHVTTCFLPEPGSAPIWPGQGYLRLWLAEGFLAKARGWDGDRFPVLHAGASLDFGGTGAVAFTSFSRPAAAWAVPGEQVDFPVTPLLPFTGGVVEIEAAVYQAVQAGPLDTAVRLVAGFADLLGPPLATAATVARAVSAGLDSLIDASGERPVLGLHHAMISPGGGGLPVRAGHLAVVNAAPGSLPGPLTIDAGGRLALLDGDSGGQDDGPGGTRRVTGVDYLVVRVETRAEHDVWLSPAMAALVARARLARARGRMGAFTDYRAEAVTTAWTSDDYVESDRPRIAAAIAAALEAGAEQAAAGPDPDAHDPDRADPGRADVAGARRTEADPAGADPAEAGRAPTDRALAGLTPADRALADEVIAHLPARDDPGLADLTLADLLAG
ncbi:hypothetical protein [Frankia canadensis]|uniref:hypothetical protein n=1 Tax=Frankia canadensis TaxID=1836972 RepID=UPI001FAFA761|nr:hypothetical protein [Frankia canadensis]